MSLKAIDNQVMITRTADQAREMATQAQRDVNAQEYLAAQARVREEHDKKSVAQTEEGYQAQLKNDREGSGTGGGEGEGRKRPKQPEGTDPAELPVGFNENKIDIKI